MSTRTPASAPWTHTAYGVDSDQGRLTIVKATRRGGHLTFSAANPKDLSTGGAVAACALQRESFIKWLTAALASARKAEKVFPALLDVQLPFSIEDCQFTLVETRPAPGRVGTCGLVAGARSADIEKRLAGLHDAGVEPHVLDQEGLALWSQCLDEHPVAKESNPLRAILYLGSERVTLAVGLGDEFLGAHSLRQADAEQLVRLLKSYATPAPTATQWLWTGPLAADLAAVEKGFADLAGRWPGSTLKVVRDPATFLARALANRALTDGPCRCNLRSGKFLHPLLQQRETRAPYRWAAGLLAAGLLLVAVNLAWEVASNRMLTRARDTIQTVAVEIAGSPRLVPRGQEVLSARRALDLQSRQLEPFLAGIERPLPATLNSVLAVGQAEGVTFDSLTLNRQALVVHGLAAKWSQCERVVAPLKALGSNVKVERKDSPTGETRVAFVLSMELNREP